MVTLVALSTLAALTGTARARELAWNPPPAATPPAAPAPAETPVAAASVEPALAAPAPARRFQVGVAFLPMSLGTFTASYGGMVIPADAALAPGVSLSAGYQIIPKYLTVGLAPQVIFNVGTKEDPTGAGNKPTMSTEYDLMARVAGSLPLADGIAIYAELLPGFSLVKPSAGNPATGFVYAAGVGAAMDLSERTYFSLGVGYQEGFQSRTDTNTSPQGVTTTQKSDVRPEYWRIALGVGFRL
jgi:hypothetical protein